MRNPSFKDRTINAITQTFFNLEATYDNNYTTDNIDNDNNAPNESINQIQNDLNQTEKNDSFDDNHEKIDDLNNKDNNNNNINRKYSLINDNSLTLVTSPFTKPTDNLLSSSSYSSSILHMVTPQYSKIIHEKVENFDNLKANDNEENNRNDTEIEHKNKEIAVAHDDSVLNYELLEKNNINDEVISNDQNDLYETPAIDDDNEDNDDDDLNFNKKASFEQVNEFDDAKQLYSVVNKNENIKSG